MRKYRFRILFAAVLLLSIALCACEGFADTEETAPGIQTVTALGFVDIDGAKLQGLAVEYNVDLTGADVSAEAFSVKVYTPKSLGYLGDGQIGDITSVYVNDTAAISPEGGAGYGRYVIIELFTDWRAGTEMTYTNSLNARVTQVADLHAGETTIPAENKAYSTIAGGKKDVRFSIPDIAGFQFFTDEPGSLGADGPAFAQEHCFSEITGQYVDEHLAYALCLPEDYHEDGTYAMVTVDNPAAAKGTHPLISVLQTRVPAVMASEWAQDMIRHHEGVDGLIVVVPVITERVDNNGGTTAEYEALVHLWDTLIETCHVDRNYVYGVGQSVGGMEMLETNRNRNNFFAGILLYEDQWLQTYYMDTTYKSDFAANEHVEATAPMHYPRTDAYITWDYHLDTDGSKVYDGHDPRNYYYLVSDDNITVLHGSNNGESRDGWNEMKYLYADLAGCEMEMLEVDDGQDVAPLNEQIQTYLNRDTRLNIHPISLLNGSLVRKSDAPFAWLLARSRQEEIAREKLDLNKPFERAVEQIQTEDRQMVFTDRDGSAIYYLTGKSGAGTQFYNSFWVNTNVVIDALPGWLPAGMDKEAIVTAASVMSVQAVNDTTLAVLFDKDMTGVQLRLAGDEVIGYFGSMMEDQQILLNPFAFYDHAGQEVNVGIQNIYVNAEPAVNGDMPRQSGEGAYLIIELEEPAVQAVAYISQRTTIYTAAQIAVPDAQRYPVE